MSENSSVEYRQPAVQWAQREDCIWLTILVENCTVPIIKILPNRLSFKGKAGGLGEEPRFYNCELDFFGDLRPGACKYSDPKKNQNSRSIIFKLVKKEEGWWPRLLETKVKQHWLKVDFTRWADPVDAEDSEAEEQEWQKKMQDKMDLDLERELISAEAEQMLQKKNKDITKDQYGRPELGDLDSDNEDDMENGQEARPLSQKEIQDLD